MGKTYADIMGRIRSLDADPGAPQEKPESRYSRILEGIPPPTLGQRARVAVGRAKTAVFDRVSPEAPTPSPVEFDALPGLSSRPDAMPTPGRRVTTGVLDEIGAPLRDVQQDPFMAGAETMVGAPQAPAERYEGPLHGFRGRDTGEVRRRNAGRLLAKVGQAGEALASGLAVNVEPELDPRRDIQLPEMTPEQTERRARLDAVPTADKLVNAVASFYRVGVSEVPASALEATSFLGAEIERILGTDEPGDKVSDRKMFQIGQKVRTWAESAYPGDPRLQDDFISTAIPAALGSFGSFIALAMATGGLGTAAGLPAGAGQLAGAVSAAGATGVSQMYREAVDAGATEERARLAGRWGVGPGVLQVLPIMRALGRHTPKLVGSVKEVLSRNVAAGASGAMEEGVIETLGQVGYNKIAQDIYDYDRELSEGIMTAGGAGAAAGFMTSFLLSMAGVRVKSLAVPGEAAAAGETDPYSVLGVSPDISDAALDRAYRRRARDVHPDTNPDDAQATVAFQNLTEAKAAIDKARDRGVQPEAGAVAPEADAAPTAEPGAPEQQETGSIEEVIDEVEALEFGPPEVAAPEATEATPEATKAEATNLFGEPVEPTVEQTDLLSDLARPDGTTAAQERGLAGEALTPEEVAADVTEAEPEGAVPGELFEAEVEPAAEVAAEQTETVPKKAPEKAAPVQDELDVGAETVPESGKVSGKKPGLRLDSNEKLYATYREEYSKLSDKALTDRLQSLQRGRGKTSVDAGASVQRDARRRVDDSGDVSSGLKSSEFGMKARGRETQQRLRVEAAESIIKERGVETPESDPFLDVGRAGVLPENKDLVGRGGEAMRDLSDSQLFSEIRTSRRAFKADQSDTAKGERMALLYAEASREGRKIDLDVFGETNGDVEAPAATAAAPAAKKTRPTGEVGRVNYIGKHGQVGKMVSDFSTVMQVGDYLVDVQNDGTGLLRPNPEAGGAPSNDFVFPESTDPVRVERTKDGWRQIGKSTPAPKTSAPVSTVTRDISLPAGLSGAKPRYNYGSSPFNLKFSSDVDRALYIVAQKKPSKRDSSYMDWLRAVMPDVSDSAIRKTGGMVRARIKELAKEGVKSGTEELDIPASEEALDAVLGAMVVREQAEITFGSIEAQAEAALEIVEGSPDFAESTFDLDPAAREAFVASLNPRAWVSIAGQTIKTGADAHQVIAPFFRSKVMEILHVVLVDADGVVLSNTAETSGAIDYVAITGRFAKSISLVATGLGATKAWIVHNHPSGDPKPSETDQAFHRELSKELEGLEVESIVIDSDSYGDVATGETHKVEGADADILGERVTTVDIASRLMELGRDSKKVGVLYLDTRLVAVALELRSRGDLMTAGEWLPARQKALGARTAIIGVSEGGSLFATGELRSQKLTGAKQGGVIDVIEPATGYSARAETTRWETQPTDRARVAEPLAPYDPTVSEAVPGAAVYEVGPEYGDINKAGESKRSQRERLERIQARLDTYLARVESLDKANEKLTPKLRARTRRVIERSMIAGQAQEVMDDIKAAKTTRQLRNAIAKAQRIVARELHRRAVDELQSALRKANTLKLRPEYLARVDAVAGDIDVKGMSTKTRAMLRATAKHLEKNPDANIPPHIRRQMERLDKRSIKDLDADEIRAIADVVRNATKLNRTKNRLLGRRKRQERDELAMRALGEMTQRVKPLKRGRHLGLEGKPKRSAVSLWLKEWGTRPEVLVEHLSPTLQELTFEDITVQAHAVEQDRVWEFRDALAESVESVGLKMNTKAFEKWRTTELSLETEEGDVAINRDEAIQLLTTIRDPSNLALAFRNGVTLDRSDRSFRMTEEVIDSLYEITGDEEKAIARDMFRQYNGAMKTYLNDAWVEVHGYDIARVVDYVPRSIDMSRVDSGMDAIERSAAYAEAAVDTWGHLKARTSANAPLRIDSALDTYLNHSEHVARISSYLAPSANAMSVLGRVDVKKSIVSRIGDQGYDRIIDSIVKQTVRQTDPASEWLRLRMRMAGASILGIRASTLLLNPSGLFVSAAYNGAAGFVDLTASIQSGANPKEWAKVRKLAEQYSPYWRTRYDNFVHESTSGMAGDSARKYGRPDIATLGLRPLEKSDQFGATIRWRMAERVIRRTKPSLEDGSDTFYDEVAREWERSMYRGENTSHGGDLTEALARGRTNKVWAGFVMFTSSVSKLYSLAVRGMLAASRGDKSVATSSLVGFISAALWVAWTRELLVSLRSGDETDEEFGGKVIERAITEAAGMLPVIGTVVAAPAMRALMGKSGPIYSASVIDDVIGDLSESAQSLARGVNSAVTGELDAAGEKVWPEQVLKGLGGAADLAALYVGFPLGGPKDLYRMWTAQVGGKEEPIRRQLNALENETDVTDERKELLRAIRLNDPVAFRASVQAIKAKGRSMTGPEVVSVINRRYGFLTKYEEGKPARNDRTPRQLELIDIEIEERDHMQELARDLVRSNVSVLTPMRGRRQTLPGRGRRRLPGG